MLLSGAQLIYRHTITADIIQKLMNDNSSKGINCSSDNCMLQNTVRLFKMHTLSLVIMKAGVKNEFHNHDE